MYLRPFKLYRVNLEPLNSSNAGDFPGVEFLGTLAIYVLRNTSHWEVSRRSPGVDVKEMY